MRKSFCLLLSLLVLPSPFVFARGERVTRKDVHTLSVKDEVCFSPQEECAEKLVNFLDGAETSIDLAIFDINLESIVQKLIEKSKTITVRILCDKRQAAGPRSRVRELLERGVDVRYGKQKGIMHHKFVVVDAERMETGSFNFTNHANIANQENMLFLYSAELVTSYVDQFEKIWSTARLIELRELINEQDSAYEPSDIEF